MVWRLSWPRIFCTVGRLIPFCKAIVANVCRSTCGLTSLVIADEVGHRLDDVLGAPRLDRERLLQREAVLQECPHAVGRRHHADLGLLAVRTALALDPELALLPEDVLEVRPRSSLTRSPVSSGVQTTSRAR